MMLSPAMRTMALTSLLFGLSLGTARAQDPAPPASQPEEPAKAADQPAEPPPAAPAPPASPPPPLSTLPDRSYRLQSAEVLTVSSGGVRELSENTLLLPKKGLEVGGELTLLTSDTPLGEGGEGIKFTDVGLLMLRGRYSFGPAELSAATELLVKQPGDTREYVPQSGSLTSRVAIGTGQAGALRFSVGPLLKNRGLWESGDLVIEAKRMVDRTLVFQGALGGSFTHLNFTEKTEKLFWFGEVVVAAETVLRTPSRGFAMWVGAEMRFPVVSHPKRNDPDPSGFLEPGTRLNGYVGVAYTFVDRWDVYARFTLVDRGDKNKKESTLPILNGGFDQQQTTFGLVYHFKQDREYQVAE